MEERTGVFEANTRLSNVEAYLRTGQPSNVFTGEFIHLEFVDREHENLAR